LSEGTIIAVLEVVAFVVIQDTLFVMCSIRRSVYQY